jgi:death-on-curing family protein
MKKNEFANITGSNIVIYENLQNEIEIEVYFEDDNFWLSQRAMAELFSRDSDTIGLHLTNIYKEEELSEFSTTELFSVVQIEGTRKVKRKIKHYNLDAILSVGYRVNSKQGTKFRQWATARLKDYLVKGFAINQNRIKENQEQFLKTLDDLKLLSKQNAQINTSDILELIKSFSHTWFSLDSFDKNTFPENGTKKELDLTSADLQNDLMILKKELIRKNEATELFAQEKRIGNLGGIFGNVFQTVFGEDAYPTLEEKAAHLLYFIIKNHPFNDGNKRSGAFSFIWFLQKSGKHFLDNIRPETLATLTILIAESNPSEKDKMVGLVKLLLQKKHIENI